MLELHPIQLATFISFILAGTLYLYAELSIRAKQRNGTSSKKASANTSYGPLQDSEVLISTAEPDSKTSPPTLQALGRLAMVRCLRGDPHALRQNHMTLRAWAELGVILTLMYTADRLGGLSAGERNYERDIFSALFVALSIFAFCTSLTPQHSANPVSRHQTEEWKGWMQMMFLLYHYFAAKEVYNAIRVFIASYVWMTGFGNFSFYYSQKDYSLKRFLQVIWRLNFFVSLCCLTMRNDYVLYYICPVHTLFTMLVYFLLRAWNEKNDNTLVLLQKLAVCASLVYVTWEIPGVFHACFRPFTFLLKYTNPDCQGDDPLHEWFFRSGLDRYVWIHGMVCAYLYPSYLKCLDWVEKQPMSKRSAIRVVTLISSLKVLKWWYHAFYVLPKLEYNRWHPYTSWIPISCYIFLRNFLPELRVWSLGFFSWCGKITLETYICQFHLWLGSSKLPNAQPSKLLVLVPGYPFVNFVLSTAVYIGVSKRVFSLTNELGRACLPQTTGELGLLVIFLMLFFGTILAAVMTTSQIAGLWYY